mmetsp:Transcript_15942/g.55609  ORF Transcript_15942/g.55609 Transcript_15942/m.55609 type:complete len:460 (-) Transcript_15942:344-1723(-)
MADGGAAGGAGDESPAYRSAGRRIPEGAVTAALSGGGAGVGAFGEELVTKSMTEALPSGVLAGMGGVSLGEDDTVDFTEEYARSIIESTAPSLQHSSADVAPKLHSAPRAWAIEPPALPSWPTPLDVSTQQVCNYNPAQLALDIAQALGLAKVDASFEKDKCQFKCVCFNQGVDTEFRIFLYTLDESRTAVEFQRRCGDAYLYQAIKQKVWEVVDSKCSRGQSRMPYSRDLKEAPAVYSGPTLAADAFDFASIAVPAPITSAKPAAAEMPPVVDEVGPPSPSVAPRKDETTQMLCNLLCAADETVRAQGVRTAAVATTEDSLRDAMLAANLLKPLAAALVGTADGSEPEHGGDVKTRAFAATALANLTETRKTHDAVMEQDNVLRALLRLIQMDHTEETAQLRREATRALANLSGTQAEMMKSSGADDALRGILEDRRAMADKSMSASARRAADSLGVF